MLETTSKYASYINCIDTVIVTISNDTIYHDNIKIEEGTGEATMFESLIEPNPIHTALIYEQDIFAEHKEMLENAFVRHPLEKRKETYKTCIH